MGGALEVFRKAELRQGDPFDDHPMNHDMAKNIRDRRGKGEESPKVKNAARKKLQQEEFLQDFSNVQLIRSLGKVIIGNAILQDLNHIDSFGQVADEFISEKGNRITITMVNLPSSISISKKEAEQEEKSVA